MICSRRFRGSSGKIDVLFVNAGVAKFAPLAQTSESVYDEMFDINIKGAYFTIQKALPFLNDGASIILNTSVADSTGIVGASAYSATEGSGCARWREPRRQNWWGVASG